MVSALHMSGFAESETLVLGCDLNAQPDDAVVQYLTHGSLSDEAQERMFREARAARSAFVQAPPHKLGLGDAFTTVAGSPPRITAVAASDPRPGMQWAGCSDYLLFSQSKLRARRALDVYPLSAAHFPVSMTPQQLGAAFVGAVPNEAMPSDHVPMVAELCFR